MHYFAYNFSFALFKLIEIEISTPECAIIRTLISPEALKSIIIAEESTLKTNTCRFKTLACENGKCGAVITSWTCRSFITSILQFF